MVYENFDTVFNNERNIFLFDFNLLFFFSAAVFVRSDISYNIIQENVDRNPAEYLNFNKRRPSADSQSEPIFPHTKFDLTEKIRQLRPSSTKKFHTYALPTPVDAQRSVSTGSVSPVSTVRFEPKVGAATQLWHSSPLEPFKFIKQSRDDDLSSPTKFPKAHSMVLKESNINSGPIRISSPLSEELSTPHFNPHTGSDTKKPKRQAFSGPLTSRHWSHKPNASVRDFMPSVEHRGPATMMPAHVWTSRPSISPKASPNVSPPPMKSPKISELHELPRPPIGSERPTRPTSLIGHSAPLVYRGQELNKTSKTAPIASHAASPLPTPPAAVHRSFSIPSRRTPVSLVAKFLEDPHNTCLNEDVASPPLTPISLTNIRPASQASDLVTQATKAKGKLQFMEHAASFICFNYVLFVNCIKVSCQ